ncbi:MAG TPA: Hsp20/alpha crystallin family protein [Blastocatellia bacterium]|nr:Hsp20/alpha crystallin family protein [Blastocatellia bacterium]
MAMYSYDQVLTDVREVYEQLTGLQPPKIDTKNPRFPLPNGVDPTALVQNEINYLNMLLINTGMSLRLSKVPVWNPASEVYETPEEYVIVMELAGVGPDNVTIQHMNNVLAVRGSRAFKRKNEQARYHNSERVYGSFERFFSIPNYARPEDLKTDYLDGVFEIRIPRSIQDDGSKRRTD